MIAFCHDVRVQPQFRSAAGRALSGHDRQRMGYPELEHDTPTCMKLLPDTVELIRVRRENEKRAAEAAKE